MCLKAVPQAVGNLRVSEGRDRVLCEGAMLALNESDAYALEEAMTLKEKTGGEVTVVTVGSLKSQDVLYAGLARGAAKAIRVAADVGDPASIALLLAAASKKVGFDLMLTGVESWDNLASQVGLSTAMKLGIPFAFGATLVEPLPSGALKVVKELGGGVYQELEMQVPALLCVQSGVRQLAYVPAAKLLQARKQPITSVSLRDLSFDETVIMKTRAYQITNVFAPQKARRVALIEGKPQEAAKVLLEKVQEATR